MEQHFLGKIFDIKKFAVHDGPGIRTTVFFKGCPLNCLWCHNPESVSFQSEIQYIEQKCLKCRACEAICPNGAHTFVNGIHKFERSRCTSCGTCVKVCIEKALILCGKEMSVEEVLQIVLQDRDFYEQSGGGATLSGGECLMQADFCQQLLKALKKEKIHCAVDTCGFVRREAIKKVAPYTDLFLYDLKHIDEKEHQYCTGQSNQIIIENLKYLDSLGKNIEIRIPLIPKMNEHAIDKMGDFLGTLKSIQRVKVLPYNNLITSKYNAVGKTCRMPEVEPPNEEKIAETMKILEKYCLTVVR